MLVNYQPCSLGLAQNSQTLSVWGKHESDKLGRACTSLGFLLKSFSCHEKATCVQERRPMQMVAGYWNTRSLSPGLQSQSPLVREGFQGVAGGH